jgi:hypothetical protein
VEGRLSSLLSLSLLSFSLCLSCLSLSASLLFPLLPSLPLYPPLFSLSLPLFSLSLPPSPSLLTRSLSRAYPFPCHSFPIVTSYSTSTGVRFPLHSHTSTSTKFVRLGGFRQVDARLNDDGEREALLVEGDLRAAATAVTLPFFFWCPRETRSNADDGW